MPGNKWGPHDSDTSKDKYSGTNILDQVPEGSNNSHIPENWMKNFLNETGFEIREENDPEDLTEETGEDEMLGTKFPKEYFEQLDEVTEENFSRQNDNFGQDDLNPGNGKDSQQETTLSADDDSSEENFLLKDLSSFELDDFDDINAANDALNDPSDAMDDASDAGTSDVDESRQFDIDDLQDELLRALNKLSNKYNSSIEPSDI